jgi:hypothetical protein
VAEATARQIDNAPSENIDWAQGYGYQFWRCRHNAYRGDGAFGQFCIVMPEQDTVLAITSGVGPMQPVLDLVWEHILPALGTAPLPANPAAHATLSRKLGQLALPLPEGAVSPERDIPGGTYIFQPNQLELQAISFAFGPAGCELTLRDPRGEHHLAAGYGAWREGVTTFVDRGERQPFVGAGAWVDADTYHAKFYYNETPFCVMMACQFVGDQLLFDFSVNASFGPTEFPQLVGRLG